MTDRDPNAPRTRGVPFAKGNCGRPRGIKDKRAALSEALASGDWASIVQRMAAKAKKGDVAAARLFFDRLWLVPKGRRVALGLPRTDSAQGVADAMAMVVDALSRGDLDVTEASQVQGVLESQRLALHTADLADRIKRLEARR
jgi:hypothetical protein